MLTTVLPGIAFAAAATTASRAAALGATPAKVNVAPSLDALHTNGFTSGARMSARESVSPSGSFFVALIAASYVAGSPDSPAME